MCRHVAHKRHIKKFLKIHIKTLCLVCTWCVPIMYLMCAHTFFDKFILKYAIKAFQRRVARLYTIKSRCCTVAQFEFWPLSERLEGWVPSMTKNSPTGNWGKLADQSRGVLSFNAPDTSKTLLACRTKLSQRAKFCSSKLFSNEKCSSNRNEEALQWCND